MEAEGSSETLITTQQITSCRNQKDHSPNFTFKKMANVKHIFGWYMYVHVCTKSGNTKLLYFMY